MSRRLPLLLLVCVYARSLCAQDLADIDIHGFSHNNYLTMQSSAGSSLQWTAAAMPKSFDSESALIEYVAATPGALGYASRISPHDNVKALTTLK
jgi:hypothetical protein